MKSHLQTSNFVRLSMLATIVGILFSGAFQTARSQSLSSLERQRASDMLKVIRDDIKKNYYDTNYHGLDVDARFKAADEKLKQATSLGQAFGIIAQAMMDLGDSHTYFDPPERAAHVEYGWDMQMIGDKCYVIGVKPGSDAAAKGLKEGDEIYSMNNFKPTRKEFWKMRYYYYRLSPRPVMQLVVQGPDGQQRQLEIASKVREGKRVLNFTGDDNGSDINDFIRDLEESEHLNRHRYLELGDAFVWKMPAFDLSEGQIDEMMNRAKGHSALILDLRGNAGGYETTLKELIGNFFDKELKVADLKGRKELKPLVAKPHGSHPFDGKVAILVDSDSASSSELFARLMQLEKRAVVIGDHTAGAVMRAEYRPHAGGTSIRFYYGASITIADAIMSDGNSLEGKGVTPNEVRLPTAADLAARRDPVFARAAELVGVRITPEKAGSLFPREWKK